MRLSRVVPVLVSGALLAAGLVGGAVGSAAAASAPNPVTGTDFHPVDPVRVLDTRNGTGGVSGVVGAGDVVTIDVSGQVPDSAYPTTSVVLNVTVTDVTASTYVTVFPGGGKVPTASNVNVPAGQTRANLVTVAPTNGQVSFYNRFGTVDLVADLAGYYSTNGASEFTAAGPTRVLDTRPNGAVGPGATRVLDLSGQVPADTTAITLNLTALDATQSTYVTAFPDGGNQPVASNLNLTPGQVVPNQVTVKVGPGAKVDLFNRFGTVDLVADLAGYYEPATASSFTALTPSRVLDTRSGNGTGNATAPVDRGRRSPSTCPAGYRPGRRPWCST